MYLFLYQPVNDPTNNEKFPNIPYCLYNLDKYKDQKRENFSLEKYGLIYAILITNIKSYTLLV